MNSLNMRLFYDPISRLMINVKLAKFDTSCKRRIFRNMYTNNISSFTKYNEIFGDY